MIRKVALLSTPWPLFNRPSIQLGTLKAYLQREVPGLKVDAHHLYLGVAERLGYDLYKAISERSWLSEACYAALLYPEREEVVQRFWKTQARDLSPKPRFKNLCRSLKAGSERVLRSVPWSSYPLIGFSICYGQLTSSLYFIRQIKRVSPHSRVVVGGSSCAGPMGESLLRVFPDIDFVVNGEGEIPLLHLVKSLTPESDAMTTTCFTVGGSPSPRPWSPSAPPEAGKPLPLAGGEGKGEGKQAVPSVPGLLTRRTGSTEGFSQLARLDDLPVPDYTDYFERLRSLSEAKRFLPKLPVEMTRGCWWGKSVSSQKRLCRNVISRRQPRNLDSRCTRSLRFLPSVEMTEKIVLHNSGTASKAKGCAFCNLNLQWKGYRSKSLLKMVQEIDSLTDRYELLSVSFVDNLLLQKSLKPLFENLARLGKDFRFFAEIRADTSLEELLAMGAAGVAEVQVGIEALSTRLLGKLNKGTTAIQNLEIMKNCEARNTPNLTSNLITHFPGSDERDVQETLNALRFALPFRPLKATPFWLGYGSPVFSHAEAFGIRKIFNHPFYSYLFPGEILSHLHLILQGYDGPVKKQQRLWAKVAGVLKSWRAAYDDLHSPSNKGPILSYQDGGTFLIIRERRLAAEDMTHRLRGSSRQIYLFCEENRSLSEIVERFPGFGQEKIIPFLNLMVDKRLMFREEERFLSLAVPIRGFSQKHEIRISKSETSTKLK